MSGPSARRAPPDPAVIGRIVKAHGINGEVVVDLLVPETARCEPGAEIWIAGAWRTVTRCRIDNKGRALTALEGIFDRDAAEALRGAEVAVDAEDLPALAADHFYVHDLVGCRVEDLAGNELGEVVAVVNGPQDLLEIEHGGERSLLPMARELVPYVNVDERRVVVDVPDGLLETTRG